MELQNEKKVNYSAKSKAREQSVCRCLCVGERKIERWLLPFRIGKSGRE